jgi:hypothetical protein
MSSVNNLIDAMASTADSAHELLLVTRTVVPSCGPLDHYVAALR